MAFDVGLTELPPVYCDEELERYGYIIIDTDPVEDDVSETLGDAAPEILEWLEELDYWLDQDLQEPRWDGQHAVNAA